jgi:hypothetical protein
VMDPEEVGGDDLHPEAFIFRISFSHSDSGTREKWNSPITGSHGLPSRVKYIEFTPIVWPVEDLRVPPR